jgi:alpha-D-ribose 1-methylphosphonate 5-triphosphate synthase subunit PhnH
MTLPARDLSPGLADPVHDSQRAFRLVLAAMAAPGRVQDLAGRLAAPPPLPLDPAAACVLLTLCDIETPLWLCAQAEPARAYLRFHCGVPDAIAPGEASLAVMTEGEPGQAGLPPLDAFALGSDASPDQSTTLILQVASLAEGRGRTLSGPGIAGSTTLFVGGLGPRFWSARAALQPLFPRGLDIVFTCGNELAALPRSTIVEG